MQEIYQAIWSGYTINFITQGEVMIELVVNRGCRGVFPVQVSRRDWDGSWYVDSVPGLEIVEVNYV